jgi:hypothetical protein
MHIPKVLVSIIKQQSFVRLANNSYIASRFIKNIANNIIEDVKHYQDRLATLIVRFNDFSAVETNVVALRILRTIGSFSKFP